MSVHLCKMSALFPRIEDSIYKFDATKCHSDGSQLKAPQEMISDFANNGFVIIRNAFNSSEIEKLSQATEPEFRKHFFGIGSNDSTQWFSSSMCEQGNNDILARAIGNDKVAGVAEQLMNRGEIYLYNCSTIVKKPKAGGQVYWHQDYGTYYNEALIFPDIIHAMIAMTKSDRENGGLQVLKGSNRCGRIAHKLEGQQVNGDKERVELLRSKLDLVHVDLSPGDMFFFHCNTLHMSPGNNSQYKRAMLSFVYNSKINSPCQKNASSSAHYNPLKRFPPNAVVDCESLELEKRTSWFQSYGFHEKRAKAQ